MIEVALKRLGSSLVPHSTEDESRLREFEAGEIIRARLTGAQRPRSLEQLRLFWACCQQVADNSDNPSLQTKEQVAFYIKVELKHIDSMIVRDGVVHVLPKSISFAELPSLEAGRFFDQAFEIMARLIDVSVHDLRANAASEYY